MYLNSTPEDEDLLTVLMQPNCCPPLYNINWLNNEFIIWWSVGLCYRSSSDENFEEMLNYLLFILLALAQRSIPLTGLLDTTSEHPTDMYTVVSIV